MLRIVDTDDVLALSYRDQSNLGLDFLQSAIETETRHLLNEGDMEKTIDSLPVEYLVNVLKMKDQHGNTLLANALDHGAHTVVKVLLKFLLKNYESYQRGEEIVNSNGLITFIYIVIYALRIISCVKSGFMVWLKGWRSSVESGEESLLNLGELNSMRLRIFRC